MPKEILSVMTDYACAFLWRKKEGQSGIGGNIGDGYYYYDNLPFSEALWAKFSVWASKFNDATFHLDSGHNVVTDYDGNPIEWDWAEFHAEGLELTKLLKQAVGDAYIVRYVKPYEDFVTKGANIWEITLEGEAMPLMYDKKLEKYVPYKE